MARKRIEGTLFTSWNEVDEALGHIGEIDRELQLLENSQNEEIDAIKARTKASATPLYS